MSSKKSHLTTLNEFKEQYYGPRSTAKREALGTALESFKNEATVPSTSISPPGQPLPKGQLKVDAKYKYGYCS